jgi:hypothetical protein
MRGVNMGYHEASAKDARQRIISFFDDHLKIPRASRDLNASALSRL